MLVSFPFIDEPLSLGVAELSENVGFDTEKV